MRQQPDPQQLAFDLPAPIAADPEAQRLLKDALPSPRNPSSWLFPGSFTEQVMDAVAAASPPRQRSTVLSVAGWHSARFGAGRSHRQSQRRCCDVLRMTPKAVAAAEAVLVAAGFVVIEGRRRAGRTVTMGPNWPERTASPTDADSGSSASPTDANCIPHGCRQRKTPLRGGQENAGPTAVAAGRPSFCDGCGCDPCRCEQETEPVEIASPEEFAAELRAARELLTPR